MVTAEPGGDDEEVYGAAWPAVDEWRRLRAGHTGSGRTLSWLETEENVLTLELALLEDFGLTLPPEREPLRGFGRKGQINWRRRGALRHAEGAYPAPAPAPVAAGPDPGTVARVACRAGRGQGSGHILCKLR